MNIRTSLAFAGPVAAMVLLALVYFLFVGSGNGPAGRETTAPQHRDAGGMTAGRIADAGEAMGTVDPESERFRLTSTADLPYGERPGEVGIVNVPEQDVAGAESFAIGANGAFFIGDTVNQRIKMVNTETGDRTGFALPSDAVPADLAVFGAGTLLVFDYAGRLDWFDFEGQLLGSLDLDVSRWKVRLEMHVSGNSVYMRCAYGREHLIAVIEAGEMRPPAMEELRASELAEGLLGLSGRRYVAELERWSRGRVQIVDASGRPGPELNVHAPGIVSLRFLGEDEDRNVFWQVERVANERVFLDVHKFDDSGELAAVIRIPENDYFHWTAKLLTLDFAGNLYQALPQEGGLRLNVFQPEADDEG